VALFKDHPWPGVKANVTLQRSDLGRFSTPRSTPSVRSTSSVLTSRRRVDVPHENPLSFPCILTFFTFWLDWIPLQPIGGIFFNSATLVMNSGYLQCYMYSVCSRVVCTLRSLLHGTRWWQIGDENVQTREHWPKSSLSVHGGFIAARRHVEIYRHRVVNLNRGAPRQHEVCQSTQDKVSPWEIEPA
jgi:hypothetical protein